MTSPTVIDVITRGVRIRPSAGHGRLSLQWLKSRVTRGTTIMTAVAACSSIDVYTYTSEILRLVLS